MYACLCIVQYELFVIVFENEHNTYKFVYIAIQYILMILSKNIY